MTKLQIRTKFVNQTGRFALVTNAASNDYTDNGADFHIDEALAFLDDKLPHPGIERSFIGTLHADQQVLYFPDAKSVERVVIVDGDDEVTLDRNDCWDRAKDRSITGTPSQYWVDGFDGYLPFTAETLATSTSAGGNDTLFDGEVTPGWGTTATGSGTATVSDVGTLSLSSPASSTVLGTLKLAYGDPGVDSPYMTGFRKITVEFTLDSTLDGTPPAFVMRVLGNDSMEPEQQENLAALTDGRYSYTFDAVTPNGFVYISFRMISGVGVGTSTSTISNVRVYTHCTERLTFWPVPESDTTIYGYGRFLNKRLIAEADSNWWTLEYPHLVIRAAKMSLEGQLHRNETGEDAHYRALIRDIRQIYMNRYVTPKYRSKPLTRPG